MQGIETVETNSIGSII